MTEPRPEISRLAAELRRLRERSGLTYAALGERTPYSKSAWQRYLTAKTLPPWSAVQDLCRLVDEPESRLRAHWKLAESVTSGRGTVSDTARGSASPGQTITAEPPTNPQPPYNPGSAIGSEAAIASEPATAAHGASPELGAAVARTRRHRRGGVAAIAVLCVIVVVALVAFHFAPWDHSPTTSKAAATPQSEESHIVCTSGPCSVTCRGAQCTGLDPGLTLCGVQPQTLQHLQTPTGIGLEVRYNPQCRAAWARIWNTRIGDTLSLAAPGMPTQSMRVSDTAESSGFTYTPMIFVSDDKVPLKACVSSAGEPPRCYTATAS